MSDLTDLFELAEEGISYTRPYFREKWGLDERLAELKKRLLTTAPGDSASAFPPGVCFNCGAAATHKTDTGLFICGEHASLALVAGWKIKPLPEPPSA
ncbi:MAG: hypothetical protein A2390_02215 [Candidatus Liptonbacteria bacterium RIFOXYB1_FULL_36_10]|uniref:Uncharacterized protein n=1 Tax=Candidatus Liptonbacteria bacterium RIFOXYB1_FULL_36_10 TaxID=1798654 RepID=A0A1G2CN48_9BACT|nr:MAG: hypothetical protein A2390_02215 [Candidatus Liptonbacteria bacterium RIFOXYB1_FULL_36_10]